MNASPLCALCHGHGIIPEPFEGPGMITCPCRLPEPPAPRCSWCGDAGLDRRDGEDGMPGPCPYCSNTR